MSVSPIDTSAWQKPLTLGDLKLKNRVLVAPCTRSRANVPGALQAQYYAQRATAGLIVTEASLPVPQGYEFSNAPGIYLPEQIAGWKLVTDAVHAAGGLIVQQIMNIGRVAHPVLQSGQANYGPSAIAAKGGKFRQIQNVKWVAPTPGQDIVEVKDAGEYVRPIAIADPWVRVAEFKQAFINSKAAGFDGVEVHGANGYLIAQFLDAGSNQRTDEWGGSGLKRGKFALEVVKAAIEVFGAGRVGIKITPEGGYNDQGMSTEETLATFGPLLTELSLLGIAYVHLQRWFATFDPAKRGTIIPEATWRKFWKGAFIVNGGYTPEEALSTIQSGQADAVLFGRDWIATPDLVERLIANQPLNIPDWGNFYGVVNTANPAAGYLDGKRWGELSADEQAKLATTKEAITAAHAAEIKNKAVLLAKQTEDEAKGKDAGFSAALAAVTVQ